MSQLNLEENLKKYANVDACPIRNVISRFSGKWALLVLCVLAENEATRFNAICKAIPDISPKVLTDTLKNLEADGYVIRKMYTEIPPKVEYSLSSLGQSLMDVIRELITWTAAHYEEVEMNRRSNKR
ncbi:MAG: helix-turn-helix transcriptional regulator [Bacteroides sp.]|nr:helix-turn-helix transcriptional regulator [Bacteroides sp.]MCM1390293.1 helix-turn-helix transcriptional regulator [Bacteroides sp.]